MTAPRVSIIIPSYESWATLPEVLNRLHPQIDDAHEVIVVDSSTSVRPHMQERYRWVRFLHLERRSWPGQARNAGVANSFGSLLVFLDADSIPEPDWLTELERAGAAQEVCVAGAVTNATPGSLIGTADFLLAFSELLPGSKPPIHGAACNLALPRTLFDQIGGFAADLRAGEDTLLTYEHHKAGRLRFCSQARVRHINRTSLGSFLAHQELAGRSFAQLCARTDLPYRRWGRAVTIPVAVPLRLAALFRRLAPRPKELALAALLSPLLVAGLVAWARGAMSEARQLAR